MLRALGLFALTVLSACVTTTQAAPPPGHAIAPALGGPGDPYGGPELAMADRSCAPGATCSFECDQGGCSYMCTERSTCNVACDGGNCRLSCGAGATCNFECDGGNCGTGCGTGATCNMECDGGTCAHACAPDASCNAECDGGNCSSVGIGARS